MRKQDIKEVLRSMGASSFKDSGESIMTNCVLAPWTHDGGTDRKPSLGVKEDQGMSVAHCFTCGFKGGLMTLVRRFEFFAVPDGVISSEQAKQIIDFIFIAEDEEVEVIPEIVDFGNIPDSILSSIGIWHPYFEERGITKESFEKWGLGYYDDNRRIMFPVYNGSDIVGVVGRTIDDDAVKYKNYPTKFKKSYFLYGFNLKPKNVDSLVVVEGPIDAVKVNQVLGDDYWCVALMGSEPSRTQMDLLVDNANEIICFLDNDSSGKKGQKELIDGLSKRVNVSIIDYPDETASDPDSLGNQIIGIVEQRKNFVEWRLGQLLRK